MVGHQVADQRRTALTGKLPVARAASPGTSAGWLQVPSVSVSGKVRALPAMVQAPPAVPLLAAPQDTELITA